MRRAIASLHRWLGIVLGLYLALMGITGAAMVFQATFYEWEFGVENVRLREGGGPWAPPSVWFEKAQERYGPLDNVEGIFGAATTPMRITAPKIIYDVDLPPGPLDHGGNGHGVITVDPYTGEPLAHFIAEKSMAIWPWRLHNSLFFGDQFGLVLTILTIAALFFATTGLILWWPRRGRWRASLTPAAPNSPAALRKSHTVIGAWIAVLLVVFSVTGFGLYRIDLAMSFAQVLGRVPAHDRPAPAACAPTSMDAAWSTALATNPDHDVAMFILPANEAAPYSVYLRPSGAQIPTRGWAEVRFDANCGRVIYSRDPSTNEPGDVLLSYLVDVHNGRILGVAGEVLVVLSGLALFATPLMGIGAWLWRRRRAAAARRLPQHGPARLDVS